MVFIGNVILFFYFFRCLNGVYSTACISKIHSSFGGVKAIDVPDVEKFTVRGKFIFI